jgi:hypothetical protein
MVELTLEVEYKHWKTVLVLNGLQTRTTRAENPNAANGNTVKVLIQFQMKRNKFESYRRKSCRRESGPTGLLKP